MRTTLGFIIVGMKRMWLRVKIGASSSRGCQRCQVKTKFLYCFSFWKLLILPDTPDTRAFFDPLIEIRFRHSPSSFVSTPLAECPSRKPSYTSAQVSLIMQRFEEGDNVNKLAKDIGLSKFSVSRITRDPDKALESLSRWNATWDSTTYNSLCISLKYD